MTRRPEGFRRRTLVGGSRGAEIAPASEREAPRAGAVYVTRRGGGILPLPFVEFYLSENPALDRMHCPPGETHSLRDGLQAAPPRIHCPMREINSTRAGLQATRCGIDATPRRIHPATDRKEAARRRKNAIARCGSLRCGRGALRLRRFRSVLAGCSTGSRGASVIMSFPSSAAMRSRAPHAKPAFSSHRPDMRS